MVFQITVEQMAILFLFMALGYLLMKRGFVPKDSASTLSKLQVYVFLPAMVFKTFVGLRAEEALSKLPLLGVSLALLLACLLAAVLIARVAARTPMERDIYIYSLTIPNLGYMGYPLVEAVMGPEMLLDFMIFVIPFNIFIYTAGMYILNPNKKFTLTKIVNAPMVAMALGIVLGLCGWQAPAFLVSACASASGCMAPCAMLLTGFVLAGQPFLSMVKELRSYVLSVIKLLAMPLATLGVMYLLHVPQRAALAAVITVTMPFGLNSVVFPEAMGGDSTSGARLCFLGNLMAILTIPLMFNLLYGVYGL